MGIPAPKAGKPHKKKGDGFGAGDLLSKLTELRMPPSNKLKKAKGHTLQ
jgi:hypothetical protein